MSGIAASSKAGRLKWLTGVLPKELGVVVRLSSTAIR